MDPLAVLPLAAAAPLETLLADGRAAPAAAGSRPPAAPADAAQPHLSAAASALARSSREPALPVALPAGGRPGDGASLAAALRTMVQTSGLFFESHLAQWGRGERATQELIDEAAVRAALDLTPRQMSVLAGHGAAFVFSPWAGQSAELVILEEHREAERHAADGGAAPALARLELTLAGLGPLSVTVGAAGARVDIVIRAAQPHAEALLAGRRGELEGSLRSAGLEPVRLDVLHGG